MSISEQKGGQNERNPDARERERERERVSEDRGGGPGGGGEKGAVAQEKGRLFSSMESTRGGEREQTKTRLAGGMQDWTSS